MEQVKIDPLRKQKTNNKTMKKFIILVSFLLNSCGCWEYDHVGFDDPRPDAVKKFTIVNHTDKTYTNNALYDSFGEKIKGIWKSYSYSSLKINNIGSKKTIHKNEKSKALKLSPSLLVCSKEYEDTSESNVTKGGYFLLSLEGGNRKVFFGVHDYESKKVWKANDSDCKNYYTWDIHPVWQEKELTITIEKDGKITFSDPKIKEVKKISVQNSKEIVDLHTLEIVPCDEE